MNHTDRIGGLGSNNIMSLWTWPWTQSRSLVRVPRKNLQNRQNRQNTNSNSNHSAKIITGKKLFLVVAVIGLTLFWQDYDASPGNLMALDLEMITTTARTQQSGGDGLKLAVLVAGSTQRFLFGSFVEHVVRSSSSSNGNSNSNSKPVHIDYYAILMLQAGPAFRQDLGYMGHLAGRDQVFDGILATKETPSLDSIRERMMAIMTDAFAASSSSSSSTTANSATLKALRLLEKPIEDDPILNVAREREQKRRDGAKDAFDLFQQFPMLDLRQKALARTQVGNKNMIRLFLSLESLWKTEFSAHEKQQQEQRQKDYDYVLILRDDTLWLDDFDLHKIVATDPTADAYVLSCDARDPRMLPPEINDHGILIRREKADLVGAYVSSMVNNDLQKCHESVTEWLGKDRGCNSEMILKYILEANGIKVQTVPQSIMPFERSVVIDGKSGGVDEEFYCYHKFCQSVEAPLELPLGIQSCKKLTFDA